MYKSGDLKRFFHKVNKQTDKALITIGADKNSPKSVPQIRKLLVDSGERRAAKWNISAVLRSAEPRAIHTKDGWELTDEGIEHVLSLGLPIKSSTVKNVATDLRRMIANIKSTQSKKFVTEALECFEESHHRAAVVLSWVGAVNLLYEYVLKNKLSDFNAEAKKRDAKWKDIKTIDDFGSIKEYNVLQILRAISVLGKSVKDQLEERLKFRNACGHPNTLKFADHSVASHLEILILNVYDPYG